MNSIRWKKKIALLSTGLVLQVLTIGPVTGGTCDLSRFPSIGVWDWIDQISDPSHPTRLPINSHPSCHDGVDNDNDGVHDEDDPDCWDLTVL